MNVLCLHSWDLVVDINKQLPILPRAFREPERTSGSLGHGMAWVSGTGGTHRSR